MSFSARTRRVFQHGNPLRLLLSIGSILRFFFFIRINRDLRIGGVTLFFDAIENVAFATEFDVRSAFLLQCTTAFEKSKS